MQKSVKQECSGHEQGLDKAYSDAVKSRTIIRAILANTSSHVDFSDFGQVRKWIWENRFVYTMLDMAYVSKIPKDRLRNIIYGVGLAYPRAVVSGRALMKIVQPADFPSFPVTTEWLTYALNKYTKGAIANILNVNYLNFIKILKSNGLKVGIKPEAISEIQFRQMLLETNSLMRNRKSDLAAKYGIVLVNKKSKSKKHVVRHEKISAFISKPKNHSCETGKGK